MYKALTNLYAGRIREARANVSLESEGLRCVVKAAVNHAWQNGQTLQTNGEYAQGTSCVVLEHEVSGTPPVPQTH